MKRMTWEEMCAFHLRKFRGKLDGKQLTITVIDSTYGGNVEIRYRRGRYCRERWSQEKFLDFIKTAKEVKP